MIETSETIDEFLARHTLDVEGLIREAAAKEVMPRWRRLGEHDVDVKTGPHDLVTDADREAELFLTKELGALLPGSVVVGEEAVHADPASYEAIKGDTPVWIVDPVDGTRQFVRGETGFCTLVALARRGVVHASWTFAPAREQFATAVRGWAPVSTGSRCAPVPRPRPGPARGHLPPGLHHGRREARPPRPVDRRRGPRPCGSAGLEYLAIARGESDAVAFSWEAAWDHAAGLLLVEEAGGTHLTRAGLPFAVRGGNTLPFTAARDEATARRVVALLSDGV